MTLTQFFDKQSAHWKDLVNNSHTLYNIGLKKVYGGALTAYAEVSTKDENFILNNTTFLSSSEADAKANDLNAEIAEHLADGTESNINVKVNYGNGNYDIISYEVLQAIARDDSYSQLTNPTEMVVICAKPKLINSYKNPDLTNKDLAQKKPDIDVYLNQIREKWKAMNTTGDNHSFVFSINMDKNGNTTVKHSFDGSDYAVKEFCNGEKKTFNTDVEKDETPPTQSERIKPQTPLSASLERFKKMLG